MDKMMHLNFQITINLFLVNKKEKEKKIKHKQFKQI